MISNQRRAERIDVDLRVTVTTKLKAGPAYPLLGRLENLSVDGMRISFPFHDEVLDSNLLNISLTLPPPFGSIRSQGEIQWKRWDAHVQRTICGVKIANLTFDQILEINEIIDEVRAGE